MVFMKGTPFRGCGPIDAETWEGEPPEVPDFGDTFIYVRREALFPRSFEYETTFSEEFSPEDRITVDGVAVCIRVAAFAIEVTIEGEKGQRPCPGHQGKRRSRYRACVRREVRRVRPLRAESPSQYGRPFPPPDHG